MFEQAFKNIDDVLWKEAGCTTELDYTEQTSWLLFLKYLDNLEEDKAMEAALEGRPYTYILDEPFRWERWAAPKDSNGALDHNTALTGDDLRDFVNLKLFPYLHGFKQRASGPNTIEYKIGEIFGEIKNKISSGYNLREIIDYIDENGNKALPYIIHRTSLGCYERTLAYLIEEYAGALPTWMMPEQVRFLPVTDRAADYCANAADALRKQGFRAEVDERNEKIGKKIREATLEKIPYLLVVGDRDMEAGTVSVRTRRGEDLGAMPLDEFAAVLREVVDEKQKI